MTGLKRLLVVALTLSILSIPAVGMSSGPGYENADGDPTVKYGCNCHNNGAASTRAVVMVTGVPVMYELGASYEMTIKVADSLTLSGGNGNTQGGFLMTSDGVGIFSWCLLLRPGGCAFTMRICRVVAHARVGRD